MAWSTGQNGSSILLRVHVVDLTDFCRWLNVTNSVMHIYFMIKPRAIKLLLINQQTTEETGFDEESAFCIQLFCIDEKYEMRSVRKNAKLF